MTKIVYLLYKPDERGEMVVVAQYDDHDEAEAHRGWMDVVAARKVEEEEDGRQAE